MSAAERREEILETAVADFAISGLHGTSTEAIAQRAGISQPYLFRLFGTKKELFIACIGRCFDRTQSAFRVAAEADESGEPLEAMGQAYVELLADRELLLAQMQTYAACGDEEIRTVVRRRWGELYRTVARPRTRCAPSSRRACCSTSRRPSTCRRSPAPREPPGPAARCTGRPDVYHAIVKRRVDEGAPANAGGNVEAG